MFVVETVYPIVEGFIIHLLLYMITVELLCPSILALISYLMDYIVFVFFPGNQSDPSLLILDIPEEQIKDEITLETAIAERIKAGKKRAKKLKQRVTIR